jgi:putative DNA primase/helicase
LNPVDQFLIAIVASGMTPPTTILDDGKLHRFSPTGKRGDDAGWYVLHLDGVPAGSFGNWRDGYAQCWSAKDDSAMTATERKALAQRIEAMRHKRDTELRQRQADAAAAAFVRWAAAVPPVSHPYLSAKGVNPYGVRIEANHTLLIPMRDADGRLHSLQAIAPDGTKRFMPGGKVKGCYHAIGRPTGKLAICEGYATGATIHEDTGHAVAVAFNAGNLLPVAKALRTKYPCITLVLCADDDWKTEGNPGLTAATEAARAVGGLLAVPKFDGLPRGDKDTDFNDLHRLAGMVGVSS